MGGSGVKAGVVDVEAGELVSDRLRVDTPEPSTPPAVAAAVKELVDQLDAPGRVGLGFPSVMRQGWVTTANNIDRSWIGVNALELFETCCRAWRSACSTTPTPQGWPRSDTAQPRG